MARLFRNYVAEYREVQTATRRRDEARRIADSWSEENVAALERNAARFPTLPADAQLAVAGAGLTDDQMLGLMSQEAAALPRRARVGETVAAAAMPDLEVEEESPWWKPIVDNPVTDLAQGVLTQTGEQIPKPVRDVTKGLGRVGFAALDTGPQLAQALGRNGFRQAESLLEGDVSGALEFGARNVRSLYGAPDRETFEQTDLGALTYDFADDFEVDTGEGWFVAGSTGERRDQVQRDVAGVIRYVDPGTGEEVELNRTIGRMAANVVFEPGSRQFNVVSGLADAAVAVGVPSADLVVDVAARAGRSAAVEASGGLTRHAVLARGREGMDQYLTSERGVSTLDWFVSQSGAEGWENIYRRAGGKFEPRLVSDLVDASTVDEAADAFRRAFDDGEEVAFGGAFSYQVRDRTAGVRIFGTVPPGRVDLTDAGQAVRAVDDFALNARLDRGVRADLMERMGRASTPEERYTALEELMRQTARRLADDIGLPADRADEMTRMVSQSHIQARATLDEMMGMSEVEWSRMQVGDELAHFPGAHLVSEFADTVSLPDAAELRRATGMTRRLNETMADPTFASTLQRAIGRPLNVANLAARSVNSKWKDLVLIRGAYTVRVVGEEQIRMAAAGLTSMVAHPLSHLAIAMGTDSNRLARALPDSMKRSSTDLLGERFRMPGEIEQANVRLTPTEREVLESEFAQALSDSRTLSGLRDTAGREVIDTGQFTHIRRDGGVIPPPSAPASARMVDPSAPGVGPGRVAIDVDSRPASAGEIGPGPARTLTDPPPPSAPLSDEFVAAWRDEIMTVGNDLVAQQVARADGDLGVVVEWLTNGSGSREYRELVARSKGALEDPDQLRRYLRSVEQRQQAITGGNAELMRWLQRADGELPDLQDIRSYAPEAVVDRVRAVSRQRQGLYDQATDNIFEYLATKPTNFLSRSPTFRSSYWETVAELAPLAENPRRLIDFVDMTDAPRGTKSRIRRAASDVTEHSRLTPEDIDEIAKARALDATKDLLYDLSQRGQFWEATRLLFPFGEAWQEVVTTWSRLVVDSPGRIARQVGNTAEGGVESGFFRENANGEMVFVYPFTEELTQRLAGAPVRMEGRLAGLNLAGETLPGLGPVAQYPAAQMLPREPEFDTFREILMPFGEPANPRDLATWLPSWARTLMRPSTMTEEERRLYGNTQFTVMRYLASTGDYELEGPQAAEESQRLLDDAATAATRLHFVRAGVQFGAPSSPSMVPTVMGPDGELADQQVLLDRYYALLDGAEDTDQALFQFVSEVGIDNLLLTGRNTAATVHGGVPLRGEGYDWVRSNPEVVRDHPELYGFFAPQDISGDFNYEAYKRALETGEIESLDNDQKLRLANHRWASAIYRDQRAQLPERPTDEQASWLRGVKQQLVEDYPGYLAVDDIVGKTDTTVVIDRGDVDRALANPALRDSPIYEPLSEYWEARQMVLDSAADWGISDAATAGGTGGWRSASAGAELRWWLRNVGDTLAQESPEFSVMWDQFLSFEFEDDLLEEIEDE